MSRLAFDGQPQVRLATAGDVESIDAIASACRLRVNAAQELERPTSRVWVAGDRATVLGFLVAWRAADELTIQDVGVHPEQRRRGVGRVLVDTALSAARSSNVQSVLLEVRPSNVAALALYRAARFVPFNVRRRYYRDPPEDALELRVSFTSEGAIAEEPDALPWPLEVTEPAR